MARTASEFTEQEVLSIHDISEVANDKILYKDGSGEIIGIDTPSGLGDVIGPANSTDGVPALFNGTTGKILKNSTPTGTGNPVLQTSPTLTTPRFADNGFIADSNGNEIVSFNQNASAVNYLEIENGATGNPPHLRSMGDDANIGLHLVAKGTGEVSVCDATDETKRLRFGISNNGTGIITTIRSNSTGTSKTIDFPNASGTLALTSDLTDKLDKNTPITGATKTKITYDADGLVTAGADAGISDIAGLQTALDGKLASTNTKAQFDTACTNDNFAFLGQNNVFTNNQSFTGLGDYGIRLTPGTDGSGALLYATNAANSNVLFELGKDGKINNCQGINAGGSIVVNGQNRTSGWTIYSNTLTWSGGTTDPGISASDWSYKQIGKTVFVRGRLFGNSGNRTELDISIPVSANNSVRTLLPNYMTGTGIDKVVFGRMFSGSTKYLGFVLPMGANRELYTEFFYEAA